MDKIWWIAVTIFAAAFLLWIYRDGKFNVLMSKKIAAYRSAEILTILYTLLIIFAFAVSFIHLLF